LRFARNKLPLRQLQLDAAVALIRILIVGGIERLELGKSGRD
jgi:hypothetical protein